MPSTSALEIEGLTVRYGDTLAVDGLDLRIEPGETVALLGSNGAGKSSTVNAALGLFRPAAGTVRLLGREPAAAIGAGGVGAMLQTTLGERTKLLSQLEQAKMQEQVSASLRSVNELAAPGNTPSLGDVCDKIELRYANALDHAELAQNSVEGRMLEVHKANLDVAGASRLQQIRAGLSGDTASIEGDSAVGAIGSGSPDVRQPAAQRAERPEQAGA